MLVDLPEDYQASLPDSGMRHIFDALFGEPERIKRHAPGVYEFNHWNPDLLLPGLITDRYPLDPFEAAHRKFPGLDGLEDRLAFARLRRESLAAHGMPSEDYGVIDYPTQLVEKFPGLATYPMALLIAVVRIARDDQPPSGGWRWHKWGDYLGDKTPTCEYIHDEPDINEVWTFHVYGVDETKCEVRA